MSKQAFDQIAKGLKEALAVASGAAAAYKLHIPTEIEATILAEKENRRSSLSRRTTGSTLARE